MPGQLELEFNPPGLDLVEHPLLAQRGISLRMLRLDQVHPQIHGNKWFKLAHNLLAIRESGQRTVLSFGGAYSNHLVALAAAGKLVGFKTIGLVRGEISDPENPVLAFLREQGMELHGLSREDYRKKNDPDFTATLNRRFGAHYRLPEGGSNSLAVQGCQEIADYIAWENTEAPRLVVAACGTGATLAGVILGLARRESAEQHSPTGLKVRGISVLKAPGYLQGEVAAWLRGEGCNPRLDWDVLDDYHCGGYARTNPELRAFLAEFATHSTIPIEPVYTGKMLYGLFGQISSGAIPAGTEVVAIHSGGVFPLK